MGKTLGKRLISGVTAALTAVMMFPNVMPTSMAGETPDINSAKTIFSLDREGALKKNFGAGPGFGFAQGYKYPEELFAQINFEDEAGNPADVKVGDNQYYLLVHSVGMDNPNGGPWSFKYKEGDNRDYYQLIEIGDGPSWTSDKFSNSLRPASGFQQPEIERVDGILLKNDGDGELSLEDATYLKNCKAVDAIEGYTILPSGDLTVRTTPTADAQYGNDTVAVKAKASTYVVDLNIYDVDGNRSFIDKTGYNYYMLTYIAQNDDSILKRENLTGWAIQKVTPDASNAGVGNSKFYQEAMAFSEFIPFGEDGSSTDGEKIKYDKSNQSVGYRLYRTLDSETELKTYADCVDTTKATDTIPSYVFENVDGENSGTVNVYKDQLKEMHIEFDFNKKATIKPEENYYVFVTVEHLTGDDSYYIAPINANGF